LSSAADDGPQFMEKKIVKDHTLDKLKDNVTLEVTTTIANGDTTL